MSHAVEITTSFSNWEALNKALAKLGWGMKENSKIRTYPSDPKGRETYEYVAVNPSSTGYDMGVKVDLQNGKIAFIWDSYGGSIERSLGKDFVKLKVEYAAALVEEHYDEVSVEEETSDYIILEAES